MKILICDDQAIIRDGLVMLLKLDRACDVVGVARNGLEAVTMVGELSPDIVLMDLKMPVMNGIEATHRICAQYPKIKILILTTYDDDEWIFDAIRAGASGYLLKDTPHMELIAALKGTMAGRAYTDPQVTQKLLQAIARQDTKPSSIITDKLTPREIDVLRLLARGFNNVDIANSLHLSQGTVRNHLSSILTKLKVSDRTQAAILAVKHNVH